MPAQGGGERSKVTGKLNFEAVLLDMDGTLLDTERVYFKALVGALAAHGFTDDVGALCHAMVGLPGPGVRGHADRALWRGVSAC